MVQSDKMSPSMLEPPPRTSLDDPGAHDLSSEDEHFSDAQTGISNPTSPNQPTHKEPRKIALSRASAASAASSADETQTPGGLPIPFTVVEKVDPELPSHGDIPGTAAHEMRLADAVPDAIVGIHEHPEASVSPSSSSHNSVPIPTTIVERVDAEPSYGEVPGTDSFEKRKQDAEPDILKVRPEESPTSPPLRSPQLDVGHAGRRPSGASRKASFGSTTMESTRAGEDDMASEDAENEDDLGDDFDDFEEGDEDVDFGDFGDAAQDPAPELAPPEQPALTFPMLNFSTLSGLDEITAALQPRLDVLYPPDSIDTTALPPLTGADPVFQTPRSASLWEQLVTPPPLQPPDWIRSRIRRLFLVSLGVPVDLDEILPASKQKKLILPSMGSPTSPRNSAEYNTTSGGGTANGVARLKKTGSNNSSTSVDLQGNSKGRRSDSRRRKGPPPPPVLDLVSARLLCSTTEAGLGNLDDAEIRAHIVKLEALRVTAGEALNYWVKRTDEKIGDREAFEAVIENLVKHARKVRK